MTRYVVTSWHGTYLLDGGRIVLGIPAPSDPAALAERARCRRTGRLTPEEEALLANPDAAGVATRDRRIAEHGCRLDWDAPLVDAAIPSPDRTVLRAALLEDATGAIAAAWDPSVHLEEAVRAAADLDRVRNLVGERLGSWVSRDLPDVAPGDHARAARAAMDATAAPNEFGPPDPSLSEARRRLAELYRSIDAVHEDLTTAVARSIPARTPNLAALLGPDLAARLVAQAGGIDRLARLPASTVQVLGAEAAFFEHLRGRAPPPRHGLLFLHPAIQGAPRRDRGRLARTLAGKAAIAARLDRAGAAVRPELAAAFATRRERLSAERTAPNRPRDRRGSRKPLHRAARDR